MRSYGFLAAGFLLSCLLCPVARGNDSKGEGCSGHGTSVNFYDTPSIAARHAQKEEKLVFVLHVSGHFEDPRFT
jgi:hypothetical protein